MSSTIDKFVYLRHMCDDDLFNELQQTRVELFCAEYDQDTKDHVIINTLKEKEEIICIILDDNGYDAHRIF